MSKPLSLSSIVTVSKNHVGGAMDQEMVLLNMKDGMYYGLNNVATYIWEQIQEPIAVARIRDALVKTYAVDPARCEADLLALLRELEAVNLIEIIEHEPGS